MSTQLVLVPTCDQVTQEAGAQDAHFLCLIVIGICVYVRDYNY